MILRTLLVASVLAACGGSSPPAAAPAEPVPAEPAKAEPASESSAPTTCEDACTSYGSCWEEQNPSLTFMDGGDCISTCDERTDEERQAYFACIGAADCAKMEDC